VYKYRFASRQLLAESLGVKPENGLYEKLEILVKHGYLAKRFDKQLKLLGVPAAYFLTPKGLRALQNVAGHDHITDSVIKLSYKDKTVSQSFIQHTLDVYRYTNALRRAYPDLKIFTKRDMSQYEYFPEQSPDAFLSLPTNDPMQPKRFFFDLVPDATPRYVLDRRIAHYSEFFDEGGWGVANSELPVILLVAEKGTAEKRMHRYVRLQLNRSDMEDLQVFTTTTAAISHMFDEKAIWTDIQDTDDLLSLELLS